MLRGGVTCRYVHDVLSSVRLVINVATGQVAQRVDCDSWGVITSDSSPGFQPFGFAGGLFDGDTRLTRFGARDYAVSEGRWVSPEPLLRNPAWVVSQAASGMHVSAYAYALNNPIRYVDPTGLWVNLTGASSQLRAAVREMMRSSFGASMFSALNHSPIEFRVLDARFGNRAGERQLGQTGGQGHESPMCGPGGVVDIRLDLRNLGAFNRQVERGDGLRGDRVLTPAELAAHEFWHAQDYLGGFPAVDTNELAADGAMDMVGLQLLLLKNPGLAR
jgi:RHS repeat-associated protein